MGGVDGAAGMFGLRTAVDAAALTNSEQQTARRAVQPTWYRNRV